MKNDIKAVHYKLSNQIMIIQNAIDKMLVNMNLKWTPALLTQSNNNFTY